MVTAVARVDVVRAGLVVKGDAMAAMEEDKDPDQEVVPVLVSSKVAVRVVPAGEVVVDKAVGGAEGKISYKAINRFRTVSRETVRNLIFSK